jgi:predicted nuclease of restriction endonuclease-like (RecB) superfamily
MLPEKNNHYEILIDQIGQLLETGRHKAKQAVYNILIQTYWEIGRYIVEYEQKGKERAEYGTKLFDRLSKDLTLRYGKSFARSNFMNIRKLYLLYPIVQTLSGQLTWSHYCELLAIDDELERLFYEKQTENEKWTVRELRRQKRSMLFHRLALSRDKEGILQLAKEGQKIEKPDDLIKDPYVLEFLKLSESNRYLESDLEQKILDNIQKFLLELGKGFAFIGRQYRITLGNRHYRVDLVFYHRILRSFVLIDLKRKEVDHYDIGQMNMYLGYFKKEENIEGDNDPIGIILTAEKDNVLIEYAMMGITSQIFISKYQLYLPDRALLEAQIRHILDETEDIN